MTLLEALDLGPQQGIALVGGGGKTSAMYQLGREIQATGKRAILTTTTRILPPPPDIPLVLAGTASILASRVKEALSQHSLVMAGVGMDDGKVIGLPCAWLPQLSSLADAIFCEADGSRGKPLKFPAAHEPVICQGFNPVLVIGLTGLNRPLAEDVFQRSQLAGEHLGWQAGEIITQEHIRALVNHPKAWGRLPRPLVVVLNQADTPDICRGAGMLAKKLLQCPGINRVVVTALARGEILGVYL